MQVMGGNAGDGDNTGDSVFAGGLGLSMRRLDDGTSVECAFQVVVMIFSLVCDRAR